MFPLLLRSKSTVSFILILHIFDLGGFCVHLSLPSSTGEGSDLILHVAYSFVDSISAYDSNVADTDADADADVDADAKLYIVIPTKISIDFCIHLQRFEY